MECGTCRIPIGYEICGGEVPAQSCLNNREVCLPGALGLCTPMPKKKNKLWTKIVNVVEKKTSFLGDRWLVEIGGTEKKVWVQTRDLSDGVVEAFTSRAKLPKNAQARVNRAYHIKQREYFAKQNPPENNVTPTSMDPVKWAKRAAKWIATAELYVQGINRVLRLKPQLKPAAIKTMIEELQPCKHVLANLTTVRFLEHFAVHNSNKKVLQTIEGQPGFLRCNICERDFKWAGCGRVCAHVTGLQHHRLCRQKTVTKNSAGSRQNLQEACATAIGLCIYFVC